MKTFLLISIQITFFFVFSSVSAQESTDIIPDSLKKEFSLQTGEWIKAYNSNDANNLLPLYSEDAIYISITLPDLN